MGYGDLSKGSFRCYSSEQIKYRKNQRRLAFLSGKALQNHLQSVHNGTSDYDPNCPLCLRILAEMDELTKEKDAGGKA